MFFFVVELMSRSFALRESTFLHKSARKPIWTETHNQTDGWSSYQAKPYHLVVLVFGSVTQISDVVVGRFDVGVLA